MMAEMIIPTAKAHRKKRACLRLLAFPIPGKR